MPTYDDVMAKKQITQLIDDLDGSILDDGTTVQFSLEGRAYEIDLSGGNAQKLRDAFEPYITAGRSVGASAPSVRRVGRGRAVSSRDLVDVRSWAQQNGFDINARGRISSAVLEAYDAAH